jgi:hypothetical protein
MLRRTLPFLVALCACGSVTLLDDGSLQSGPPTITAFTAEPSSLDAGGGPTLLSWTVVGADSLFLDPGASDVTGFTSAKVTPTATTSYTLMAVNSLGEASSSVTVTVGH